MPGQRISEDDRKKIDPKFLCSKCELLLNEPMQTRCGHLLCKSCVEDILSHAKPVCPKDGVSLNENSIFLDAFTKRELSALKLHCLNSNDCDWFGAAKGLQTHLAESCQAAPLTCEHCQLTNIPRMEMRKHHIEECEAKELECDFKPIGCNYTKVSKRKEIRKHYMDASRFHIQLLLRFIFQLQSELQNIVPKFDDFATKELVLEEVNQIKHSISIEIKTMEGKFTTMMATLDGLIKQLGNVDLNGASGCNGLGNNAEVKRVEVRLGKEVERLQAKNIRLETELREAKETMGRYHNKMEQIDESVAVLTARFSDLQPTEPPQARVTSRDTSKIRRDSNFFYNFQDLHYYYK